MNRNNSSYVTQLTAELEDIFVAHPYMPAGTVRHHLQDTQEDNRGDAIGLSFQQRLYETGYRNGSIPNTAINQAR